MAKVGPHRPFASKAQWRLFFANPRLRRYAKDKAHATGGHSAITHRLGFSPAYRALPDRKGSTFHHVPTGKNAGRGGIKAHHHSLHAKPGRKLAK
jgi:hypothetical protein